MPFLFLPTTNAFSGLDTLQDNGRQGRQAYVSSALPDTQHFLGTRSSKIISLPPLRPKKLPARIKRINITMEQQLKLELDTLTGNSPGMGILRESLQSEPRNEAGEGCYSETKDQAWTQKMDQNDMNVDNRIRESLIM